MRSHRHLIQVWSALVIASLVLSPVSGGAASAAPLAPAATRGRGAYPESAGLPTSTPAAGQSEPAAPTFELRGVVLTTQSTPAADLTVQASPVGGRVLAEAVTDAQGRFVFPELPRAGYILNVIGPDGVPLRLEVEEAGPLGPGLDQAVVEVILHLAEPWSSLPETAGEPAADEPAADEPAADWPAAGAPTQPAPDRPAPPEAEVYRIGGRVLAPEGPAAGVVVRLLAADGAIAAEAVTDDAGAYKFPAVVAAAYTLTVWTAADEPLALEADGAALIAADTDGPHLIRDLRLAGFLPGTAPVAPEASGPGEPAGVGLQASGQITGLVTAADTGLPLASVSVRLYNSGGALEASLSTSATGLYAFNGLATGSYRVEFDGPSTYVTEWYSNAYTQAGAATVRVVNGLPTTGINAVMDRGPQFTGQVTAALGGAPLSGVSVSALDANGSSVGSATTNASGVYTVSTASPSGQFRLRFNATGQFYVLEFFDSQPSLDTASVITATVNGTVGGLNAVLDRGVQLTGRVLAADSLLPLNDVDVALYNASGAFAGATATNPAGAYTVTTSLSSGPYRLQFTTEASSDSNTRRYAPEYYSGKASLAAADPLTATVNAVTTAQDATLDRGATISGTVTTFGAGQPYTVTVRLYTSNGSFVDSASSAGGAYQFEGLSAGSYKLEFAPASNTPYVTKYYDNRFSLNAADVITVALNNDYPDRSVILDAGGIISGTIFANGFGSLGVADAYVQLYNSNGSLVANTYSDAAGVYTFGRLFDGDYRLRVDPASADPLFAAYVAEYFNNAYRLQDALAIPAALNTVQADRDVILEVGGRITGTVTAVQTGLPISGVTVYFYNSANSQTGSATTNGAGLYTSPYLPPDDYRLRFVPGAGYGEEYYNNRTTLAAADPVTLGLGDLVTNVDAALESGGRITGRVTGADTGLPLANIYVTLYNRNNNFVDSEFTNAAGVYTFTNLISDTYRLAFDDFYEGYLEEYYSDRASLSVADPLTVTPGVTLNNIDAVLDRGGRFTGRVTAAAGGAPLANVSVSAYSTDGFFATSTSTNAAGVYTLTSLAAGGYNVFFDPPAGVPLAMEWYDNQGRLGTSTVVTAVLNTVTAGIDAALEPEARLIGQVTAADTGLPFTSYAEVEFYDSDGRYLGYTPLAAGGYYTFTQLPAGAYRMRYDAPVEYLDEYYNNRATLGAADPVTVTTGATLTGLNATLDRGARLTGTVTAAAGGAPLPDVSVEAYTLSGSYVRGANTNAAGVYTLTSVPAGPIIIRFSPDFGAPYAPEYYNNRLTQATADILTATVNTLATGVNAALEAEGRLTGRLLSAETGQPLTSAYVYLYNSARQLVDLESITAGGYFTFTQLPATPHYLEFWPYVDDHVSEFYNNRATVGEADALAVTAGGLVDVGDVLLDRRGRLTGTVTAQGSGAPLAGVPVRLLTEYNNVVDNEVTNASGIYTFTNVEAGSYRLRFYASPDQNYAGEFYNDKPSLAQADPVTATLNAVTGNLDAQLAPAGVITGQVTAAESGLPLAAVSVRAYSSQGALAGSATTAASGVFTLTALAAGAYRLYALPPAGYLAEFYNDKPNLGAADPVNVTAGAVTGGADLQLSAGGLITGTVTGGGGPLAGVTVRAYTRLDEVAATALADPAGAYTLTGLLPASYRVGFFPPASSNFLREYWNDEVYLRRADPLTVTAGLATASVNADLAAGGRITGTVTADDTGLPLKEVSVNLYNADGVFLYSAVTDMAGVYTLTQLLPEAYRVSFEPLRASSGAPYAAEDYAPEYYPDQPFLGLAQPVTMTAGLSLTLNAGLARGAAVLGQVTAADDGSGLNNVRARAYDCNSALVRSGTTDSAGAYALRGLPAGAYRLWFDPQSTSILPTRLYLPEYHADQATLEAATPVTATVGISTTVDAALSRGGQITGRVTRADSGLGLNSLTVRLYNAAGSAVDSQSPDSQGNYASDGLVSGDYRVYFDSFSSNYLDEYYNDRPNLASADPVTVAAPGVTSGVDAVLAYTQPTTLVGSGLLRGRVTDAATGLPLAGIYVSASQSGFFNSDSTDSDGEYGITGLLTGTVSVTVESFGAYARTSASLNVAGAGAVLVYNPALERGGRIAGRVTDAATGLPLANALVYFYSEPSGAYAGAAYTDASGYYLSPVLPPGLYRVWVFDVFVTLTQGCGQIIRRSYPGRYYNAGGAEVVTLAAGALVDNIDLALAEGLVFNYRAFLPAISK